MTSLLFYKNYKKFETTRIISFFQPIFFPAESRASS